MRPRPLHSGVVMRQYERSDAPALLDAVDGTRQRLARWMPWVPFATTVADFEDFIDLATAQARQGRGMHCGLFDGQQVVGGVGAAIGALNFDEADVGYWLAVAHEGRGIAAESVSHLIEWLLVERDMHRITIRAAVGNTRSRTLAERLGFTFEAVLRESLLLGERHEDAALYSLLEQEWAAVR